MTALSPRSTRPRPARRTLALASAGAVFLAIALGASGATPAFASTTASLSGTVYGAGSPATPLSHVEVTVELPGGTEVADTATSKSGKYSIKGLPAGDYIVGYSLPVYPAPYEPEFWGSTTGAAGARILHLAKGGSASITMTLPVQDETASISGQVTDGDGVGVRDASVEIQDGSGYGVQYNATTDGDGDYDLTGLIADTYTLEVSPPDGSDLTNGTDPDKIVVTAGQTITDTDVTLVTGAQISGTITEGDNPSVGLGDGQVLVENASGDQVASASVGDDGTYTVTGIPTGSFTLDFQPSFGSAYEDYYWQDATSFETATFFDVTAGDIITGRDAAVPLGATISGTLETTGSKPTPVTDGTTFAVSTTEPATDDGSEYTAFTGSDGTYSLIGLDPGTYTVEFETQKNNKALQWWKAASTQGSATVVTVTAGETVTDVDASLATAATISGKISEELPSGETKVLNGSQVQAYSSDGKRFQAQVFVGASGSYTITDLPAGSYRLEFDPEPGTTDFNSQFYKGKSSLATATVITVTAGEKKTGVNVTLSSADLQSVTPTISGTAKVGSKLTAHAGAWKPSGVVLSYQWLSGGVAIDDATGATYTPTASDVGAKITVAVTGTKTGYTTESRISASTKSVVG